MKVTYTDFSRLAKKRGWTPEMLVELFKGKTGIEEGRDEYYDPLSSYFGRVLSCQWLNPETKRMETEATLSSPTVQSLSFTGRNFTQRKCPSSG